mmetsp:Transcript_3436/g.14016  ORF Transcript_3436/g.14016 Transcript_3436/m.14016 type:complete len:295 (-) Transcript_3436:1794-2678(-)
MAHRVTLPGVSRPRYAPPSIICTAKRSNDAPGPTLPTPPRRVLLGGAVSSLATRADPAVAYGLGNAPPPKTGGLFGRKQPRSEAEIRAIREEAERRREEREAEENPGELVTLPSGIQYRELDEGRADGKTAARGDTLYILYTVYRLAPGAYFKYSSGGTPIFLWSRGYGNEGQDDVGATYRFILGDSDAVPRAVAPALVGMREGGRRRVLVPPQLGWTSDAVRPRPGTFGAGRRLENHKEEPLLFEAELTRVRKSDEVPTEEDLAADLEPAGWSGVFKLPAPPSPFRDKLGETS